MQTKIKMTKKNRLAILRRAREIITDPKNWTQGRLRRRVKPGDYRYCLLGACEQAAYDLELANPKDEKIFNEDEGLGYRLGRDLSLSTYSMETRKRSAHGVNDSDGHQGALSLLDDYIAEVRKNRAREPQPEAES